MLLKMISNFFMGILFVFILGIFIYLTSDQNKTQAAPVQKCSLTYIIGCDLYYCWTGHFNNFNCAPCGSNPPCI
jgi:hypothetical protein